MQKIEPTYVTFEQAKLLASKEFDVLCHNAYNSHGMEYVNGWCEYIDDDEIGVPFCTSQLKPNNYAAPEQWQAIEWVRINHYLWIVIIPTLEGYYTYKIVDVQLDPEKPIERPPYKDVCGIDYHTPQGAYSAAFDYILKELI